MARKFNIPDYYCSSLLGRLRLTACNDESRTPIILPLGRVCFKVARHFGFCFGVQNAIEIAYRALEQNPGRGIFLLSEMIHNPRVNADLSAKGFKFMRSSEGGELISFSELSPQDVVVIPAFGVPRETMEKLQARGVTTRCYDATCPFVKKVWARARQLGEKGYTIIIHGQEWHEETRATFSYASSAAPSLVVRDLKEAKILAAFLRGQLPWSSFVLYFSGRYSDGFNPPEDLKRLGVVNQTTMLAAETQAVSAVLRQVMLELYGEAQLVEHFADTSDTLCYATNKNQEAVKALIESGGDLALVVGGYKSSNTSHLVRLCQSRLPAYYIEDAQEIVDAASIRHFDLDLGRVITSRNWLPLGSKEPLEILLTAGASCPDAVVDEVIVKIAGLAGVLDRLPKALEAFSAKD